MYLQPCLLLPAPFARQVPGRINANKTKAVQRGRENCMPTSLDYAVYTAILQVAQVSIQLYSTQRGIGLKYDDDEQVALHASTLMTLMRTTLPCLDMCERKQNTHFEIQHSVYCYNSYCADAPWSCLRSCALNQSRTYIGATSVQHP